MRFGMFVPQGWRLDLVGIEPADQWGVMKGLARRADAGPWDSLWLYDHFHTVPVATDEATHEAWTLMAAFAAVTERVRLGQMCTCVAYRNPVHLAKIAATVDLVSGGRVELGIGAGWYEQEWRAYGYGFPPASERLGRLDETAQVVRQAWREGRVTLDGRYHQVRDAIVAPTPLQDGGIPLWIAGGGEKVTLRTVAKYAQYANFGADPDLFSHKSEILAGHCRDVGTDFDAIVRSANINTVIGRTEAEVAGRLDEVRARLAGVVGDQATPHVAELADSPAVGTPEQIVERLRGLADRGLGYGICYFPEAAYDRSGLELFEREVIPALT